jgi:uncharacterized repeat protein (TIGR03837 family)
MTPDRAPSRWDIFCRVVDNFGDVGVCWRLAAQLAASGERVRLVVDDASALAWMAPRRALTAPGVEVWPWPGPEEAAEVVIEAFGCDLPEAYVHAMHAVDPVWINLEYLSAEAYVERSHGLPSPRADGLRKWFFYPGFTTRTGGLLREPGLLSRHERYERDAWLAALGCPRQPHEQVVSLFCYENTAIGPWLDALAARPTLLLLTPGWAQRQVQATPPAVRTFALPWLEQTEFDHLLWASDLNAVRGEDSLVRALWAGAPFLWQAYPQRDGAQASKLRALMATLGLPADVASCQLAWNGLARWPGLPPLPPWRAAVEAARARLLEQDDLATQLRRFARSRMPDGLAGGPAREGACC